jgi:renalase
LTLADSSKHQWSFDHGAPYFTARDPDFRESLKIYVPPEIRPVWRGRFASLEGGRLVPETPEEPRMVGVPGMSAIARSIAAGLGTRTETKVVGLTGSPGDGSIVDADGSMYGPFEWVVATAPPAQSAALLSGRSPIAEEAGRVVMRPCFTLMIVPAHGATLPFDGIRCDHPILGWAAIDGSKPGRSASNALVIQSNNERAEAHPQEDLGSVARALKEAASAAFGLSLDPVESESLHRWLYARPVEPLGRPYLIDPKARLAICGDWGLAGKIEGAYRSGDDCAAALMGEWN